MSIVSVGEPSPEVEQEQVEQPEGGQEAAPEGGSTVAEAVASDLADDTMLEIEDAEGNKQVVSLKDLRDTYRERDRHRKAADQKFTEADKIRKGVQSEVAKALQDPTSFLKWIETQKPDFKTVDYFFQQLERDQSPEVIDRLAAVLKAKLEREEAEAKMTPEARRVRELEEQNKQLQQQWEEHQDNLEEQALFNGVKGAVEGAGLNPTPLVTMMALEIVADARMKGIELSQAEAAQLLKEQVTGAAEKLFAKPGESKDALPPRGPDGKFQATAKQAPGATDVGAAAQAKRVAKENNNRVSVVKQPPKKKADEDSEKPMSFLEAIRSSYTSV